MTTKQKRKPRKTITLCDSSGSPGTVVCPGHVCAKEFNDAFKAEGWSERGGYKQGDLRFEYMVKGPARSKQQLFSMKISLPGKPGAKPYTVTSWD